MNASGARRPVVIAGPTASGKSALALSLLDRGRSASAAPGVVVCADSRQVYAGMQVGAAGPSDEEETRAEHMGYGTVDPLETYSAQRFLEDTDRFLAEAKAKGAPAVLVGGAGMYLRALRFGLDDVPGRDDAVRAELEAECEQLGTRALWDRLSEVDPPSAAAILDTDPVRVVRALEIWTLTGRPASAQRRSHDDGAVRFDAGWYLLEAPQGWLSDRIAERAKAMLAGGLLEEAGALRDRVGAGHRLLETMGIREALALLDGALTLAEAAERIAIRQRQYARRQRTWFKKEPWWTRLDARDGPDALAARILEEER